MKILFIIYNDSKIVSNKDVGSLISNLTYIKDRNLMITVSDDCNLYSSQTDTIASHLKEWSTESNNCYNRIREDLSRYIIDNYKDELERYHQDTISNNLENGYENIIHYAFVHNLSSVDTLSKLYHEKFDISYKIRVTDDTKIKSRLSDIILNTAGGLRDLSIQLDRLMDKIKEEYTNV